MYSTPELSFTGTFGKDQFDQKKTKDTFNTTYNSTFNSNALSSLKQNADNEFSKFVSFCL